MFTKSAESRGEPQMSSKAAKFIAEWGILALSFLLAGPLRAQVPGATLSGTISDPSGAVIPNAKISIKSLATDQLVAETQADLAGLYKVQSLMSGDYEISASAEGFITNVAKVTITAEPRQTLDLNLGKVISLGDLGFSPGQTKGNDVDQARLDKRSHMLMIHQRLGLVTAVPLVATCVTGIFAGGRSTSSTGRDVHIALGSLTAGMYFTTAYYAIFAPKIQGTHTRGPIRLHKALEWIHGPGMILTPILGAMAYDQRSRGEKVHGIASAHGAVAIVTAAAYGASILAVSLKW
jgi:hypothetical protein